MANAAAPVAGRVNTHPLLGLAPGLALTAGITLLAYGLRYIPGVDKLSPMILAILIGATIHNTMGNPAPTVPGIQFSLRRILRFSIILIGLQITAQQAAEVGFGGIAIIATGLVVHARRHHGSWAACSASGQRAGAADRRRHLHLRRLGDRRRQDRHWRRG